MVEFEFYCDESSFLDGILTVKLITEREPSRVSLTESSES